jgi:uncharacterized protein (DUF58 family)
MIAMTGRWPWPAALALVAFVAGIVSGWPLPERIGLVLIGLLTACLLATLASAWALSARGTPLHRTAVAGDTLTVRYLLRNHAPWPVIWTVLHAHGIAEPAGATRLVAMPPRGRRQIDVPLSCPYRGNWPVGGWRLQTGDPFGLFGRARSGRAAEMVLVYPRPLLLPDFTLPTLAGRGANLRGRAGTQPTAMVREVRPYQPGDVLSRIHWISTARRGALMVREPESEPAAQTWLAADLDASVHLGEDAEETIELVISAAAYLVDRLEQAHTPTGLLVAGPATLIPPSPRRGHADRLREALSLAMPASGDIGHALDLLPGSARWGALLVITPWADSRWSVRLAGVTRAGGRAVCILVQTPEAGNGAALDAQATALDNLGVRVYRYRGWAP